MKNRLHLLAAWVVIAHCACAATIRVSPSGDDASNGSPAHPVRTLQRAAELVREARAASPGQRVTVRIAAGEYPLLDTLAFGAADSGSADAPVTWQGDDRERVRILGATALQSSQLSVVSDPALLDRMAPEARGRVVELDLSLTPYRSVRRIPDYVKDSVDLISLFHDGKRLPLSRWPNGEYGYTTMRRVLASGSYKPRSQEGGVFEYREDRPARWMQALGENAVWVRGFWRVPWTAETLRVADIDTQNRTIRLAVSTAGGIGSKYSTERNGSRAGDGKEAWFALNLLEEIDQPGEWSIDFVRGRLYVWPPEGEGSILVADNPGALLAFKDASHITFRNLTFGMNMGEGIEITGGESVRLAGVNVQSIVKRGVVIRGGRNHEVVGSDLYEIGLTAIDVLGGDRRTLSPAGHRIVNNHIYRVALASPVPALTAGLDIRRQEIVGCLIAHNRIHDTSYGGITFAGNENILENNEIYRIGLDGGDLGGFYTTGGWTSRGNIVRGNFIHHAENSNAIYMDDGSSGLLVEDNLIYRTESGVFIGGGHDHVATGNIIIGGPRAIHVDDRGVARRYVADDPRLRGDFDSMKPQESPWRERYPELLGLVDLRPEIPRGNVLVNNVAVACATLARRSGKPETLGGFQIRNNLEVPELSAFRDPASLDFRPADSSEGRVWVLSASRIAERAGLFVDENRPKLPPRDIELLRTGDTRRKSFDSQQDVEAYKRE